MDYTILIHQAEEGGFWSEVPALPGCYSQGETIDETLRSSKEAIEDHLQALKALF
jgi:predicted RNase H-like HicB family nuclease